MTKGRMSVWWAQIRAVIRLEMRKTFFAKRGLWIYLLAALPVLIFMAYAVATSSQQGRQRERRTAGRKAADVPGFAGGEVRHDAGRSGCNPGKASGQVSLDGPPTESDNRPTDHPPTDRARPWRFRTRTITTPTGRTI